MLTRQCFLLAVLSAAFAVEGFDTVVTSDIEAKAEATIDVLGTVETAKEEDKKNLTLEDVRMSFNVSHDVVTTTGEEVAGETAPTKETEEEEEEDEEYDEEDEDDEDDDREWVPVEEGEEEDHENWDYKYEEVDEEDEERVWYVVKDGEVEDHEKYDYKTDDREWVWLEEGEEEDHENYDYIYVEVDENGDEIASEEASDLEESEEEEEEEEDSDDSEEEAKVEDEEEYAEEEEEDEEDDDEEEEDEDEDDEEEEVDEEGPGSEFGVVQIVSKDDVSGEDAPKFNETAVFENLNRTETYMNEVVWKDEFYSKVQDTCYNYHTLCAAWAAHGECEENPDYMDEMCAPACMTCEQLHYETRCPFDKEDFPDVWQAGDMNKMFESIVESANDAENKYDIQVLSRPSSEEGKDGPWMVVIDNFFTAEEADHMIQMAGELGWERNMVSGGADEETGEAQDNEEDEAITSSSTWCVDECDDDEVTNHLFDRLVELTDMPMENAEFMQMVKYDEGEFYLEHYDYVEYEQHYMAGPRILTALMYFNDVEEGGETHFNRLDIKIKPKLGRLLLFPNVKDDAPDQYDDRTEHQALPLEKGQKFVSNTWMHLRDMEAAIELGCQ